PERRGSRVLWFLDVRDTTARNDHRSFIPDLTFAKLEGAPLTLLRYAFAEVFRGRRRTISAVVGVAIAVSFLAGTSLAIDSSVSIAMGSYLSRLDRDFTIFAPTAQARQLADNLSAVPGVTFVAPYRQIAAGSELSTGNPPARAWTSSSTAARY